ncbi:MAG: helix-turn-helix domain-containing protein [Oscillospiraceae bacterium]|nr:helix-turn-helix domain-containing protein [Oscillospiraceae bacterium]
MNEYDFNRKVAENLVRYRKLHGMTQAELAECISYSNKSVSKWERGEGVPDAFVLFSLSEIYGITLSELVGQTAPGKQTAGKLKAQEKAKKKAIDRARKRKKKEKK